MARLGRRLIHSNLTLTRTTLSPELYGRLGNLMQAVERRLEYELRPGGTLSWFAAMRDERTIGLTIEWKFNGVDRGEYNGTIGASIPARMAETIAQKLKQKLPTAA